MDKSCNGSCDEFRTINLSKDVGETSYGRCQTCHVWVQYDACNLNDGSMARPDSTGWYCNCCNGMIQIRPCDLTYQLQSTQDRRYSTAGSERINLEHFSKHRAEILQKIAGSIPQAREDSEGYDLLESFRKNKLFVDDVEEEFNADISEVLDYVYADTANKLSLVAEFEWLKSRIGHVPTIYDIEKHSRFDVTQYEVEFSSLGHFLERLNYDPWYRNDEKHTKTRTGTQDGLSDSHHATTSGATEIQQEPVPNESNMEMINQLVPNIVSLIKNNTRGIYMSDIKLKLHISDQQMAELVPKLLRVERIVQKEIKFSSESLDMLFLYDFQYERARYNSNKETDGLSEDDSHGNNIQYESGSESDVEKIQRLAENMVKEHIANKIHIKKDLQRRLTKEFIDSGLDRSSSSNYSLDTVIANNRDISEAEIRRHVRTSLRLPLELKTLENDGSLHTDPECSLQIALFAVNHHKWNGDAETESTVTNLALQISRHIAKNASLGAIFSGKTKKDFIPEEYRHVADKSYPSRRIKTVDQNKTVVTSTAVWIATATLHREHGIDRMFAARLILDKVIKQGLCDVTPGTVQMHIARYCVANNTARAEKHRKIYRVARGAYRLYHKDDPYHPDRKYGPKEPDVWELPEMYMPLVKWYREQYCKYVFEPPVTPPTTKTHPSELTGSRDQDKIVVASIAVWVATATLHKEHGINMVFTSKQILDKVIKQRICNVTKNTIESHIARYCVANNPAGAEKHRKIYRVARGAYRLYHKDDPYHPDRKYGLKEPSVPDLPKEHRYLIKWYYEQYCLHVFGSQATQSNTDNGEYSTDSVESVTESVGITTSSVEPEINTIHAKANELYQAGKYDEAIMYCDQIIKLDPNLAYPYISKGVLLENLEKYEEAIASYDTAIELEPDNADAHCNKGDSLGELERHEEAITSYDKAIELEPDNADAHCNKGDSLGELERHEEAITSYDKAIELEPNMAHPHIFKGMLLGYLGRREEAIVSYDKAIELAPNMTYLYISKGISLRYLGRREEAIVSYDKAIELEPDDAFAHCNKGDALESLGRSEDAIASYDKAIELEPDNADAHLNKGISLEILGKYEKAVESYDKAIELEPDNADAHNHKGDALEDLGRYEEAKLSHDTARKLRS